MKVIQVCTLTLACLVFSGCTKKTMSPVPPLGSEGAPCQDLAPWGFPQLASIVPEDGKKKSGKNANSIGFLCRKNLYAVGYDQSLRVPRWTLEVVSSKNWKGEPQKVRKDWRPDPFVPSGSSVQISDYSKEITQGAVGVKSMVSYKNYLADEINVGRTFYLSNTVPSIKKDDEPGAWERLEDQVLLWSETKGDLIVISGPIFLNGAPLGWVGHKEKKRRRDAEDRGVIAVPSHFYKVILDPKSMRSIAFMMPNNDSPYQDLPQQAKRLKDIERASGVTFFPGLSEDDRAQVTDQVSVEEWPLK